MAELKFNIRQAILDDLPQLLELEQNLIEDERPFDPSLNENPTAYYDMPNLISAGDTCLVVVELTGSIIACGYARIKESKKWLKHDQHAYLGFMFVAPDYRGQGLNQRIINFLIEWAKAKDIKDFALDVYAVNAPAIRAYQKAGFEPSMVEMRMKV